MWSLPSLVAVIGLLVLINGLFASMEIALVSVPRARLKRFKNEKRPGASTAISLQKNIDDFFATVQIGVTFVATLSSAIGGAAAVGVFSPIIDAMGISPSSVLGHAVAILFVTVNIFKEDVRSLVNRLQPLGTDNVVVLLEPDPGLRLPLETTDRGAVRKKPLLEGL